MACVKRGLCVRSVVAGTWDKGLEATTFTQGEAFSELNGRMEKTGSQRQSGGDSRLRLATDRASHFNTRD